MFTGIIEEVGEIIKVTEDQTNKHFTIRSKLSKETYIDQSIAHNGVCLTVVEKDDSSHVVTAIKETLDKSNLGVLKSGQPINLERAAIQGQTRMDGHVVQGHVDDTAICTDIRDENGSWVFTFKINAAQASLIVDKGSVTVNGVSLTVCDPGIDSFAVSIIPYTYEHTTFHTLKIGDTINIEFDIIGKYVQRYLDLTSKVK